MVGCWSISLTVFIFLGGRRKLVMQNLEQAFPSMTFGQITLTSIKTINRTIEQGLLVFAWPFLSIKRIEKNITITKDCINTLNYHRSEKGGTLWLIPHFCHADSISFLSKLVLNFKVNALYRPLKNLVFDNFVKKSRQRFGMHMINRKDGGMLRTLKVLKQGHVLAMLFDQNAGAAGTRLPFMGRDCSCTTLPDILHKKYNPNVFFVYTRRQGFWRSSIEIEKMERLKENEMVIEKANLWLESKLRDDRNLRESWLWMHKRWKPGSGKTKIRTDD